MSKRIATLHLVCGLPASGKTAFARELETRGNGVRLTPDEWMLDLGHDLYDGAARERVEGLQWRLAQRLLTSGVSAILDNGFWARSERDHYRTVALSLGAGARTYFMDAPLDVLKRRIIERNRSAPRGGVIDPSDLDHWAEMFERPSEDELAIS